MIGTTSSSGHETRQVLRLVLGTPLKGGGTGTSRLGGSRVPTGTGWYRSTSYGGTLWFRMLSSSKDSSSRTRVTRMPQEAVSTAGRPRRCPGTKVRQDANAWRQTAIAKMAEHEASDRRRSSPYPTSPTDS